MVFFQWTANTEPDMSHYRLYQRTGQAVVCIAEHIPHPQITVGIEMSRDSLANSAYFLTAVDTEGFESDPSNEAVCDQVCIDKYLSTSITPRKITGVELEP